ADCRCLPALLCGASGSQRHACRIADGAGASDCRSAGLVAVWRAPWSRRPAGRRPHPAGPGDLIAGWTAVPDCISAFGALVAVLTNAAMRLSDFDFHLPREAIAQRPVTPRDAARMLHLPAQVAP